MNQLYNFFVFFIIGIIISCIFDLFRITRKIIHTNNIITYIEDIIFWIISGFLIVLGVFSYNNGELRIYLFLGILLGVLIYISLLSKIVNKILLSILLPIKKIISKLGEKIQQFIQLIYKKSKKSKNKSKKAIQKESFKV